MFGPSDTVDYTGGNRRIWAVYRCARCGGAVLASSPQNGGPVTAIFPGESLLDGSIPEPARQYLSQAFDSQHSPAGAVMLAASAVDAMLKAKGLKKGRLAQRIDRAAAKHLITTDMAKWAHRVRLDANEPRHADEKRPLPSTADAKRSLDFALALAQFMFVLPAQVDKALAQDEPTRREPSAPEP